MTGTPRPSATPAERQQRASAVNSVISGPDIVVPDPVPALRRKAFASLGIMGMPGAGKTHAALRVALRLRELDGDTRPVLVIDVQHGQVLDEMGWVTNKYGPGAVVWLDWLGIDPTVHPRLLVTWLQLHAHRYSVVVIDPLSKVWTGALTMKDALVKARYLGGNEYVAWGPITDPQDGVWTQLMDFIGTPPSHVIVVARMKEKLEKASDGGREMVSLGAQPQWKEETTYEIGCTVEVLRPTGDGKYRHRVWRTRGDQPFDVMVDREDIDKFATDYHTWLNAADEPAAVYVNPQTEALWKSVSETWRGLPDSVKTTARPLLRDAGLLSDKFVPLNPFTLDQLGQWTDIVATATATETETTTPAQSGTTADA